MNRPPCEAKRIWGDKTGMCRQENDAALLERCFATLAKEHGWTEQFLIDQMERQAKQAELIGCSGPAETIRKMIAARKKPTEEQR